MSNSQKAGLVVAVLLAAFGAYLRNGGPDEVVAGIHVIAGIISLLNLFQQSPVAEKLAAKAAAKIAAKTTAVLALFCLFGCSSCSAGAATAAINPGVDFAICVIGTSVADVQAGAPAGQIVADCIEKCGGDAATVARVLDANQKAIDAAKAASK